MKPWLRPGSPFLLAVLAGGLVLADEPAPAGAASAPAPSGQFRTGSPRAARRGGPTAPADTSAVDLSRTPPSTNVVTGSPLYAQPAPVAMVEAARRDFRAGRLDNINRDAVKSRVAASEVPTSVERSGSAFQYLRQKPTWRGVRDLFNPLAPVERPEVPGAMAFETRKDAGTPPRPFRDAVTHEPMARIF